MESEVATPRQNKNKANRLFSIYKNINLINLGSQNNYGNV
jgi:hypothetical protein